MTRAAGDRRRLSIGARWVLLYTAATSLLLLLISGLVYIPIANLLLDGLDEQLRQQTRRINEMIARDPENLAAVAASIEAMIGSSAAEHELAIELYDELQRRVFRYDILAPFPEPLQRGALDDSSGVLVYQEQRDAPYPYFVRVEANGRGFTRAAIYGGRALRELEAIRGVIISALVVGAGLTGLIGWWLARQTLRPISQISETAKRVSSLGNEGWIPTQGTGDELDQLAETLNRMLERVRRSTDSMKRFAAQAAHELLTPLGVARTRIEVTLAEGDSKEEYRAALAGVLTDVETLGETVNGVLELARSGAGLDPQQLKVVDLGELLREIVEFYRPLAEDRGIQLSSPPRFQDAVFGDPVLLHRLFANLLDNAIKYSESGDSVGLSVDRQETSVRVSIQDEGIGIALKDRGRVFDQFYRGDQGRTPGVGLGLALAMEVARAHGGTIEYETPEAGGSVFHVQLPVL